MKKLFIVSLTAMLLVLFIVPAQAQRGYIKSKIKEKVREDMKEKHAEPQRDKGKKALEDITYENDSRTTISENPVEATLVMKTESFKKNGKLDKTTTSKIVFGKSGECMVMNEGEKDEVRMLYDYKGAATYIVNEKEKTAMKMPLINIQKMAERMANQGFQGNKENDNAEWKRTDEQKEINGFNCRKYIYTNETEKTKIDMWVTQDIEIDLSGNNLFGGQIKNLTMDAPKDESTKIDENFPRGAMVRSIYYQKNSDTPSMIMDITSFKKTSDPVYFNLSGYQVNDILGKL